VLSKDLGAIVQASSAFETFEFRLQSLKSPSLSRQRLYTIRVWMSEPSKRISGPLVPSFCSNMGLCPFEPLFRAINAPHSTCPNLCGNIPVRMPYVKYEGKSTVCNTRWLGIRIKRALPRNFPYLRYEVCTDGRIRCLTMNWALTW
jgi:hypothetical protein